MKTTKRFEDAVTKLYTAFHKGELEKCNCAKCAVGSIVGSRLWANFLPKYGVNGIPLSEDSFYLKYQPENILNSKLDVEATGYSVNELANVEEIFMESHFSEQGKSGQFKGLCEVVEYLCELDNIPNVMDFTSLFDTEDNKAVNKLQFN